MYKRVSNTHAVVVGLLFAMVGFSYALATSSASFKGVEHGIAVRSLGAAGSNNPLIFTNPQDIVGQPTYYDLGLALEGSTIARYARATGGVKPYTFTGSNVPSSLSVLATGEVSGSLALSVGAKIFQITVKDSLGTQPNSTTGTFQLNVLSNVNPVFQFAVQDLSTATEHWSYLDVMPVLGGNAPYTYTVSNVALSGNSAITTLAAAGLSLGASDGTVFGCPIVSGTLTFTATCKDVKGNTAAGYNGTGSSQLITMIITKNTSLSNNIVATGISVKVGATGGKDTVQYSGLINLNGQSVSTLTGAVVLKIGGYTGLTTGFAGVLSAGKITTGTTATVVGKAAAPKTPAFTGTLNSNGQLKISIKNETIGTLVTGAALASGTQGLAVYVQIGSLISTSEFLKFTVKTATKGGGTLSYKLAGANELGGDFMLTSVQGKDIKGASSDAWKAGFIALPGAATFGSPTSAVVGIGTNSSNTVTVSESNGTVKSAKGAKGAAISSLSMSAKNGKGSLQTGALLSSATNILTAATASATAKNTFALGISLSTSSGVVGGGIDGLVIFPNKTQWTSKNPTK